MGATAGVAEMLMQSHTGAIEFLPALPPHWASGAIEGLRARGGVTVDLEWKDNELKKVTLLSSREQWVNLEYQGREISRKLQPGQPLKLAGKDWK